MEATQTLQNIQLIGQELRAKEAQLDAELATYPEGVTVPKDAEATMLRLKGEIESTNKRLADAKEAHVRSTNVSTTIHTLPASAVDVTPTISFKNAYYGKLTNFKNTEEGYRTAHMAMSFILAIGRDNPDSTQRSRAYLKEHYGIDLNAPQTRALSESVNSAGGYLVPIDFQNALISLIEDFGVARKECQLVPMSTDTVLFPRYRQNMTAYWQTENSAITSSDITLNQVGLNAKTLSALGAFSNQLSEDSMIPIADYLTGLIARRFSYNEDDAWVNGTGIASYGGIVGLKQAFTNAGGVSTNPGVYETLTGTATNWSLITMAEFTNFMGKMRLYPGAKWKFYCSSAFYNSVMLRLQATGGGNTIVTIQQGSDVGNATMKTFMGYPVVITEVMPFTAAAADYVCYFGDMSQAAMFAERRQTTIALSTEAGNAFANNQTLIRGIERIDINVHDVGGNTVNFAGTAIAGPVVALVTKA